MDAAYDEAAFRALQQRLAGMWPAMTPRAIGEMRRAVVVVSSVSFEVPPHLWPALTAYEERYLFYVLTLARSPGTHVVYVTSQPTLPRVVDYYLGLTSGSTDDMRDRLTVLSVGDGSPRPLTQKILERPALINRIRAISEKYDHAVLAPFVTTAMEARLALALDMPVYGPDPSLWHLGTKTGSREVFAAAGVPMARGVSGVRDRADVVAAIADLHAERPARRYVVKTDGGGSGFGNALVAVADASRAGLAAAVDALVPAHEDMSVEEYFALLADDGGIVEEWVEADEVVSPSVQVRASPLGDVEVLSTHDQILGGNGGLAFLGCRFPAPAPFVEPMTKYGRAIGEELAARGVIGRFAIDFVMARRGTEWEPYAIEINLRNGGTTHPAITLIALTDGTYDEASGQFVARTGPKYYVASDHVERPEYTRLTADDVLDVVAASGLGWDDERQTGVALHMVSGVAAAGRIGATAIGDSPEHAQRLYDDLVGCLDGAVGVR